MVRTQVASDTLSKRVRRRYIGVWAVVEDEKVNEEGMKGRNIGWVVKKKKKKSSQIRAKLLAPSFGYSLHISHSPDPTTTPWKMGAKDNKPHDGAERSAKQMQGHYKIT